jgi:trans-aconitate methyltransferase
VMDFGCGTGNSAPLLRDLLHPEVLVGVDASPRSIEKAASSQKLEGTRFVTTDSYQPRSDLDLAYSNGVFHHIPLEERGGAVDFIYRALKPGGLFALWENNPWNPGTRMVMRRIPFDRDAVTLSAPSARRLLSAGGFEVLATHFLFIFPRCLRWLRPLEGPLHRLPLGAQYEVLCRKPARGGE